MISIIEKAHRSIRGRRDGEVRNFRAVPHGGGRVGIEALGGDSRKPQK